MKTLVWLLVGILALAAAAVWQRHWLLFEVLSDGTTPALLEATAESAGSRWHDDYFLIEPIDERTIAIGEPRYPQQNFSYLILGRARAVLFDAGPGLRDIRAVAESLTDLPITFIPSHFHYDHIGNEITFDQVAVIDLPELRKRAPDNRLALTWQEHLGSAEGIAAPVLEIDKWLAPGSTIDLGDRTLEVLYTPGHTEDSISLLDQSSGTLFTGDFIYPGDLYAFLPNSDLGDYQRGAATLIEVATPEAELLGAHRAQAPGLPRLSTKDLKDLDRGLRALRAGELRGTGTYPVSYPINEQLTLLAEPRWLQSWSDD
ncbi:MAG: MBL fold metallo-hydrolase [Pseudomonadota bacterium]